ncbi:alcohol dehydrogenase catalytic domain-containing protein [Salinarimonas sp. NSM]|uniref:alcohol dehydrogenase catalytic domain-containing protein n=1 Tax=Salinarimonas sp. NSM TaxID=3458003 RepID=UPI004036E077
MLQTLAKSAPSDAIPDEMRVALLCAPGILSEGRLPVPEVPSDGVVLKTRAVSICSTDVSYFHGNLSPAEYPVVLGHEYVGDVVAVGREIDENLLGQRIAYFGQTDFGGLAEYRAIRPVFPGERKSAPQMTARYFKDDERAAAIVVPDQITDAEAPLLEPVTAVLRAILRHPPGIDDRILVLGGGPCGAIAGSILQHFFGVHRVAVLERNPDRAALAKERYAEDVFEDTAALAEADESRKQFDYIFDALPPIVGDDDARDPRRAAMRAASPAAKYVLYGASEALQKFDTWLLLAKGINLCAAPFDVDIFPMSKTATIMRTALRVLTSRIVDPSWIITRQIGFSDMSALAWTFENHSCNPDLETVVRFDR